MIVESAARIVYTAGAPEVTGDSALYGGPDALASIDGDTTRWSVGESGLTTNAGTVTATFMDGSQPDLLPSMATAAWFVIVARTVGDYANGIRVNSPPIVTFDSLSSEEYVELIEPVSLSVVADAARGMSFKLNRPSGEGAGTAILHVTYWSLRVEVDGVIRRQAHNRVIQRGDGLGIGGGRRAFGARTIQASNRATGIR